MNTLMLFEAVYVTQLQYCDNNGAQTSYFRVLNGRLSVDQVMEDVDAPELKRCTRTSPTHTIAN